MDIEQALLSRIKSQSSVTRLVNAIRPIAFVQTDKRPTAGYFTTIPDDQFEHFTGTAETRKIELTVDIFANTYRECKGIARAIRDVLHNYQGTVEDIEIRLAKHKGDNDLTEPPDVGVEKPIHRLSSQYLVLYREV